VQELTGNFKGTSSKFLVLRSNRMKLIEANFLLKKALPQSLCHVTVALGEAISPLLVLFVTSLTAVYTLKLTAAIPLIRYVHVCSLIRKSHPSGLD